MERSINELDADLFSGEADGSADPKDIRRKAMDYLARREYGQVELITKLVQAGFDEDASVAVVEQLHAEGLQDDRRFIESFVQSRVSQGKGPVRIQLELDARGVGTEIISDVLEGTDTDWAALATEIRVKKFGAAAPSDFSEKARQMRFLQFRGFETEHIQAAMESDSGSR